jgi:hypothetical protein
VGARDRYIDLDAIEEIIRRIGVYGVLEEPDEGGSGPNEEVPRTGDGVQDAANVTQKASYSGIATA